MSQSHGEVEHVVRIGQSLDLLEAFHVAPIVGSGPPKRIDLISACSAS